MDFPSTPESNAYSMDFETNSPYQQQLEWNTLDKFLDWQRSQPEFSSPESPLSDNPDDQQSQPIHSTSKAYDYPMFDLSNFVPLENRLSSPWAQITPETMSPMSSHLSPPPPNSLSEDFTLYSEDYQELESRSLKTPTPTPRPGPQLPKIGRPRSTPSTSENSGEGKIPTQARRRSQNREAQRAFRLRQRQYIEQIAIENKDLLTKNAELEARCEMLAKAYHKVLSANTKLGGIGNAKVGGDHQGGNGRKLVVGQFGMGWNQVNRSEAQ